MKKKYLISGILSIIVLVVIIGTNQIPASASQNISILTQQMKSEIIKIEQTATKDEMLVFSNPYEIMNRISSDETIASYGIEALPILYQKIKNQNQGLLEYIYSDIIQRIMEEQFVYNDSYLWATSNEFYQAFIQKAEDVKTNYNLILNDSNFSEISKQNKISEMGLMVIPYLIDSIKEKQTKVDYSSILTEIISKKKATKIVIRNNSKINLEDWISKNEDKFEFFRGIIENEE